MLYIDDYIDDHRVVYDKCMKNIIENTLIAADENGYHPLELIDKLSEDNCSDDSHLGAIRKSIEITADKNGYYLDEILELLYNDIETRLDDV